MAEIVEMAPRGRLTLDLVAKLRAQAGEMPATWLISGADLLYGGPESLGALLAWFAERRHLQPSGRIWLCHLSPLIQAALMVGGIDIYWQVAAAVCIVPDRFSACAAIAAYHRQHNQVGEGQA